MKYNKELAKALKSEYDFNDYEITLEKLIEVTNIIEKLFKKDMILIAKFISDLHCGKLGMWYKTPISLLSVANKYIEDNKVNAPTIKLKKL